MRQITGVLFLALLASTVSVRAEEPNCCSDKLSCCCKLHCTVPPPPRCPNCGDPCEHRLALCGLCSEKHVPALLDELHSKDYCKRREAVEKLGCRLHADVCRQPPVLDALLHALQCDSCWEVRRAAAWALFHQRARAECVVLALYISSRLDPHYMVRVRAAEALDLLTLGRVECYQEMYKAADQLLRVLRGKGYQPGRDCCVITMAACGPDGKLALATTLPETPKKEKKSKKEEKAEQLGPPTPAKEEKVPVEKLPRTPKSPPPPKSMKKTPSKEGE